MTAAPNAHFAYNLYLKHDLSRVAAAFERAGIPWLLIKGFALAELAYAGLGARAMVDNDVVVPPALVSKAHRILLELGFYDRPGNALELNLAADYEHPMHYPYSDVETGFELHWHVHAPELFRGPVEPYFERAVTRRLCGIAILTLDNEDRLVQLATHWVQHGLDKPSVLRDIERVWNLQDEALHAMTLPTLVRRSRKVGAHTALALALHLLDAEGRLTHPIPRQLRSRLAVAFAWRFQPLLARVTRNAGSTLSVAEAHRLRLAAFALLAPSRAALSWRRELLPSRARLSRIVGRPLGVGEALTHGILRQARAVAKLALP